MPEQQPTVYKKWPKAIWEQFCQEFAVFFSMAVSNTVLVDGVEIDSLDHVSHFGICSTSASTAAKTVAISQFNLVSGAKVVVKFENTNTASNPTLNVNSTGAVSIKYKGSDISSDLLTAGSVIEFVYDGTYYQVIGISEQGLSSGLDTYTTGTSYTSGTPVIKDNAIYQANTNTSSTWVDSEWTKMNLVTNTNSTYLQKILTNITAPYELLLSVGNTNYCKAPINVLKKTGGGDNVTLTLENYNNASAYTGTSDFLKIENSKAKLYNYKEYPITPQTLSTIDIGVSDEIDFGDFAGTSTEVLSGFLICIRATNNGIVDAISSNEWTIGSTTISTNEVTGPFGEYCIKNTGASYIYKTTTDSNLLFTPNDTWTFSAWIRPLAGNTGSTGATNAFCCLLNGGRALSYQRISYRHNGESYKQPCYISPSDGSGVPPSNSISISDSEMQDGNWHHIAVTQDGLGYIRIFFDGECILTRTESNNVDWGATEGTGILSELNGAENSYSCGYFDDICLIGGKALWTANFTPPSNYLSMTNVPNITSLEEVE